MTYNVPQFRASYLHRQLMCDNYTTLHATLPITISTMCMCMSPTQIRRVEPLKAKQFIPKRASPAAKVRSVCGVHASLPPSYRNHGVSTPPQHGCRRQRSAAQPVEKRKEIPGSHRTAPCSLSSKKTKRSRGATATRSSHPVPSSPVQSMPGDPRGQSAR
jgi:hypothetical protein